MLLSRFCLNKEGRGGQELRSLEVRRKLIALKNIQATAYNDKHTVLWQTMKWQKFVLP